MMGFWQRLTVAWSIVTGDELPAESHLTAPAGDGMAIVPADADLPWPTRAIYVGHAGAVRVTMLSGEIVTFRTLHSGLIYPLRVRRIHAAGTTALRLVALR